MKRTGKKGILSRLLVDAGVGLGIIAFAGLLLFYNIKTGKNPPMLWIELAIFTGITFWYPVQQNKHHWHRPVFWLGVSGLLAVHVVGFVLVLRNHPEWRLVWFIPVAIIEGAGLFLILDRFFGYSGHGLRGWRRG